MPIVTISPQRVTRGLLAVVAFLVVAGVAVQVAKHALSFPGHERLLGLRRLFDLDGENNAPSWYSSVALLWCAVLLYGVSRVAALQSQRYVGHWRALAVVFLLLSLDEGARIHEGTIEPLRARFEPSGVLYYAWIVPALVVVLLIGIAYLRFLRHLSRQVRRLVIGAFVLFMTGAVGFEMIEGLYASGSDNPHDRLDFNLVIAVEEALEMVGVVLFSHALMCHLGSQAEAIVVRLHERPTVEQGEP